MCLNLLDLETTQPEGRDGVRPPRERRETVARNLPSRVSGGTRSRGQLSSEGRNPKFRYAGYLRVLRGRFSRALCFTNS